MRGLSVGVIGLVLCLGTAGGQAVPASQAAGQPEAAKKTCPVATESAGEADVALNQGKFEDAERLYGAMPASSAATAGVVRAKLGQRKLDEAHWR